MAELPTRPLGHSGIQVSVIGLGCNQFGRKLDVDESRAVIDAALEAGINFFDTADIYGGGKSEEFIGHALRGRRDQVVLGTKFGGRGFIAADKVDDWDGPRGHPDFVRQALHASLARLQTDYVDLFWYHRPDGVTPILDTLAALDELVKAGKIRAIGASNFTAAQISEADAVAREHDLTRFTAIQNEYNLLVRAAEDDVLPLCEGLELAFIPYFPLALGLLTGRYKRGVPPPAGSRLDGDHHTPTDEQWDRIESLSRFAQDRGLSLPSVAVGGLLGHPAVASVIAGASRPEQARGNATELWIPDSEDVSELRAALS